VTTVLAICFATLVWRVIGLQVFDHEFLHQQGDIRTVRLEAIPATRGMIIDRNSEPLAVSAPVVTLWANPREVRVDDAGWQTLAKILGLDQRALLERLIANADKEFIYIKRQIAPETGHAVLQLKLQGLYSKRSHKRYYPSGEVAAHVVGMTNIDERGQEGLELTFDQYLVGIPGEKKVLIDRRGYVVDDLSLIRDAQPGKDVQLSIDLRLQTMAYREIKAAVQSHHAKAASLVVLDVNSGEILAMVNQPSYNPNNRSTIAANRLRNRAATDVFEPGSPIKALSIAAALQSGKFSTQSRIDTSPGYLRLNGRTIRDVRNYGELTLEKIIIKSSNIGTSRVALQLGGNAIWEMLYNAGFGQSTGVEYPGEAIGELPNFSRWQPVRLATLAYGYGLSATPLQLAQAYMAIAANGKRRPLTLLKGGHQNMPSQQVMAPWVAKKMQRILEKVVLKGGTGTRAQVSEYRVAGKTGTVHGIGANGYLKDEYSAIFAGFAPVKKPRLAMVVVVHSPQAGEYYGGEVAAPVFSRVMANSLRLLNVTPDRGDALVAAADNQLHQGG
jgi:cell division protein FtsI (penicillin-binding protein 3)